MEEDPKEEPTCDESRMKVDWKQEENGVSMSQEESSFRLDKVEVTRLMIQGLDSIGYNESARCLEKESGILALSKDVQKLRTCVLEGDWEGLDDALQELGAFRSVEESMDARFVLYQQNFLELLESGKTQEALMSLRTKLEPCCRGPEQLQPLSLLMMCQTPEELRRRANWRGVESRTEVLRSLQKFISPSILLPEDRLHHLLRQALEYQKIISQYPYSQRDKISLLEDLKLAKDLIPERTTHVLRAHKDEVWFVQFSHNGKYLVSVSKDKTVVIWNVEELIRVDSVSGTRSGIKHVLEGHEESQSFLAWSPDDKLLLGCGNDKVVRLWNVEDGKCVRAFDTHTDIVTACAWLSSNSLFVTAGLDKQMLFWEKLEDGWQHVDTVKIEARITDLAVSNDGKRLVTICSEKKIHIYDAKAAQEIDTIQETATMTSLCLSADGTSVLVNLTMKHVPEIHEWDLTSRSLVRVYRGLHQSKYIIRSCFGGKDEFVVISGSEDSKVYVWHRKSGDLLASLPGHGGTVNSVSWHPTNPFILASASDDQTVRIWEQKPFKSTSKT